ncbi:hypothetical protein, partial [Xanthomonas nasturtii]|uniref:hypothetical protein n=1 Tax=Xanthomonas nasturtii TaxID=1843581 RepID=UPI0020111D26
MVAGTAADWQCDVVGNNVYQVTRAMPHQIHNNASINSGRCCFQPLEPVHNLLSNSAKKAKWMNCRLVLS